MARAALRVENIIRDDDSVIRPWASLGVQKTIDQDAGIASFVQCGGASMALPAHQLDTAVTLDLGLRKLPR